MKKFGCCMGTLFLCVVSFAQDTHYWTHQFGTRSALLGGAVVGGTRDNSTIFYNPAAVAFIDSASFSINANIYQLENTRIKNVLTEAKDFTSLQVNSVPLLTSGQFKTKARNLRISYGVFSPVVFQFRGVARIEGGYDVVPGSESPGTETFVGDELLFSRLREIDVAIGTSYKLSDKWAVGLTHLFDVRTHNYNRTLYTRYYLNDAAATGVSTSFTQNFNYYNVRYMPKLGIAFKSSNWSWGATVTAPGIRVLGTGAAGVDVLATNVKAGLAERSTVTANSRQVKLKSYFKSPVSVAAGVQVQQGRTRFLISTQYFSKQGVFEILKGSEQPFVRPASAYTTLNGANLVRVISAARPVLNFAIGMEQELSERMSLDVSLRNNQSYYDAQLLLQDGIKPDITTWDIYHLTGGVTMRRERSSMNLGLALGVGRDKTRSDQYLPLPSETTFFKSPVTVTQANYGSLGILIGYNYFFNNR